ncbi:MAG: MFS transporter [Terracidiphilus sp.]
MFFAVAFFFDFGFSIYFFLFNLYLLDFHFNERTIGLVGGALTFGSVVGTLPVGWLAGKMGLRPLLWICIVAAPLLGIARTMAMWEPAQIGLAFLAGLAMCIWGVCFSPALAKLTTEENRASAFSLIFSVSIGTSTLGGIVCGYLPRWLMLVGMPMQPSAMKRMILLFSCFIASIGLVPLLRLRFPLKSSAHQCPEAPQSQNMTSLRGWRLSPFLRRFLFSMALWTAALAAFTPFSNVYLAKDLHIPMTQIAFIFSAAQVLQLSSGLLSPAVFRRLGLVTGIVSMQVATATALLGLAWAHNRTLAVFLFLSYSATQWMSSPGLYNLLMTAVPDHERNSASAMTMFCNALFQSFATMAAGLLFVQFGYPHVLAGVAAMALVAALLFRLLVASPVRRVAAHQ